jgi:UDP-3-O-[3-hydroxymyristoyl] glucosamine N-acyltransferase
MSESHFFELSAVMSAGDAAEFVGGTLATPAFHTRTISKLASIDEAVTGSLIFADGRSFENKVAVLPDCILICTEQLASFAAQGVAVIVVKRPQYAFAKLGRHLCPQSVLPDTFLGAVGISPQSHIAASAALEEGVTVEAGAIIGEDVEIGSGSVIAAGAVIGKGCKIGRNCVVGPNASVLFAYIGNRVILHAGVRIGQDGFGFVPGPAGLEKMPHIGRVIIQDDVEVGANTAIDRGALNDTVVGEGTKIDNLVQIAHNVRIGRHCVITGHCGLSGSVTLGDRVMLGGRSGVADHVTIGDGAQIAATSGVMTDVPAGERWGGIPAQPLKDLFREVAIMRNMVREKKEKRP